MRNEGFRYHPCSTLLASYCYSFCDVPCSPTLPATHHWTLIIFVSIISTLKLRLKLSVVAQAYNPRTWEMKARKLPGVEGPAWATCWVPRLSGLWSETLSWKKKIQTISNTPRPTQIKLPNFWLRVLDSPSSILGMWRKGSLRLIMK